MRTCPTMDSSMFSRHFTYAPVIGTCTKSLNTSTVLSYVAKRKTKLQLVHFRPRRLPFRIWRIPHDTKESWGVRCSLPVRSEAPAESTPSTVHSPTGSTVDTDSYGDAGKGLYTPFVDYCVEAMRERMEVTSFPMKVQPETGKA